jgi:hypothetical protein
MKQLGEQQEISELIEPQLPLTDEINGHVFSMIASGVCDADAYYRGLYDGGAAFLLIKDPLFPRCQELPLARLASAFPQAISAFPIRDHKFALTSYLDDFKIAYKVEKNAVVVREGSETMLTAQFDEQNRVTKLDASLKNKPN